MLAVALLNLLSTLFGGLFTLAAAYGLGALLLRRLAAPPEIRLAVGAAAESLLVFLSLLCHVAFWQVYLGAGGVAILAAWALRRQSKAEPLPRLGFWGGVIFAAYGIFYLVNALTPEIQADGITYHLGLAYEYTRLGGFPGHIRFYDVIPQGMEMLFTVAFAFGRHAAAKLVELGLCTAAVPLIFRIGQRLGMSEASSLLAAVFYWSAPLVGLTGSSTYNDAALVFFTLAAFYLLLVWRDTGDARYLLPAGVMAGFCYAVKLPGIFAAFAALLFVLVGPKRRPAWRLRDAALLVMGIALMVAPWMVRDSLLTGNPVAPLGNALFPNPHFHLRGERELAESLRSLHGIAPLSVPWQLALGDGLTGTFGPLLLFLPLGLLAARRPEGRICLVAAAILAVPWWSNTGARFLMPAIALAAFALAMVLPRKAAWAAIAVQALVCWPPVLNLWQPSYAFRLHDLPWKAALGIETEEHYLQNHTPEYNVAKMVEHFTPPGARTFALMPVATAYAARDVSVAWQSAEAECLIDTLRMAANDRKDPLFDWTASWPMASLRALRFRMPEGFPAEWDIAEVQLFSGADRIFNSPSWDLRAWPEVWEAPFAFDTRRATVWRTWQPTRAGMYLEVDLDHPQDLAGVLLMSHAAVFKAPLEVSRRTREWTGSGACWQTRPPLCRDLRRTCMEASAVIRRAGYQYLLAPLEASGNGLLGRQLMTQAPQWGLEIAGVAGPNVLFKVR